MLISPNWVREVCSSVSLDVYPVYEVSPDTTGVVPSTAPESFPLAAPVAVDGVLACDLNLLDRGTDLSLLAIPLFPLPTGMLLVSLLRWLWINLLLCRNASRGGSSGPRLFLPCVTCPGRDPLTPTALRWTLGITR